MKLKFAALLTIVAIGLHFYLTAHYYQVHLGIATGDSVCNVSSTFNCDSVSASQYAQIFGIPVAAFGLAANGVLLLLFVGLLIGWTSDYNKLARLTYRFSAGILLASFIMAIVSIAFVKIYCLFCMAVYVVSIAVFALLRADLEPQDRNPFADLSTRELVPLAVCSILVLVVGFGFNRSLVANYGAERLETVIRDSTADYAASPTLTFDDSTASIVFGNPNGTFVITEFADFRCSHCRQAHYTLKNFISTRPDVTLKFFNWPLDGACNSAIKQASDGLSCLLAKAAHCAETTAQRGAAMHSAIFDDQLGFSQVSSSEEMYKKLETKLTELSIPIDSWKSCTQNPETDSFIRNQAELGQKLGVMGTPSLFINKRRAERANILKVLEGIYSQSKR
jgi:uncharacterized membrane protein/protein-disulfide isomerase